MPICESEYSGGIEHRGGRVPALVENRPASVPIHHAGDESTRNMPARSALLGCNSSVRLNSARPSRIGGDPIENNPRAVRSGECGARPESVMIDLTPLIPLAPRRDVPCRYSGCARAPRGSTSLDRAHARRRTRRRDQRGRLHPN